MSRNREDRRRDVYTYTTRTDVTHVLTCSTFRNDDDIYTCSRRLRRRLTYYVPTA